MILSEKSAPSGQARGQAFSGSCSLRQRFGFRQRFSLRLRQERRREGPKPKKKADNRCRFAIATEADKQGAADQRSDRGDQTRCIEDEAGSRRTHARRKELRQPYRR